MQAMPPTIPNTTLARVTSSPTSRKDQSCIRPIPWHPSSQLLQNSFRTPPRFGEARISTRPWQSAERSSPKAPASPRTDPSPSNRCCGRRSPQRPIPTCRRVWNVPCLAPPPGRRPFPFRAAAPICRRTRRPRLIHRRRNRCRRNNTRARVNNNNNSAKNRNCRTGSRCKNSKK